MNASSARHVGIKIVRSSSSQHAVRRAFGRGDRWMSTHMTQTTTPSYYVLYAAGPSQRPDQDHGFFTPRSFDQTDSPSSSLPNPNQRENQSDNRRVSDHEYEVRVGRAYDLLRATVPEFMRAGVVDYDQQQHQSEGSDGSRRTSTSLSLLDVLAFRTLRNRAAEAGLLGGDGTSSISPSATELDSILPESASDERSFHENIHFRFCANASASAQQRPDLTDEEASSLSFSGRNLYFASAQVLRNTLNILFADSNVVVESIRRERKGARGWNGTGQDDRSEQKDESAIKHASSFRNDSIHLRVGFIGHLRVTGAEHRYTLIFRYDIDDQTGRIARHTVERVEPAIGRKLWSGLAAVWFRLTGQAPQGQPIATIAPARLTSSPSHRSMTDVRRARLFARDSNPNEPQSRT